MIVPSIRELFFKIMIILTSRLPASSSRFRSTEYGPQRGTCFSLRVSSTCVKSPTPDEQERAARTKQAGFGSPAIMHRLAFEIGSKGPSPVWQILKRFVAICRECTRKHGDVTKNALEFKVRKPCRLALRRTSPPRAYQGC